MILRLISFALTLLLLTPGSVLSAWADDVGLSASERAANIKAYNKRKAQGGEKDAPRAKRNGAGPQRQAMERARRCHEAVANAQQSANNIAMGSMALSQAASFIPFGGGMASSVAGAALGAGAMVAGEAARQKVADAANGC
ncbi:MAG: hypothetical protein J0G33_15760 [Afipia felis]|nr:hypothetical protein [Afipia felis]